MNKLKICIVLLRAASKEKNKDENLRLRTFAQLSSHFSILMIFSPISLQSLPNALQNCHFFRNVKVR